MPLWQRILREPVALCLTVPVVLRPWLDGITYPTDNFYFVWYLTALFAVWAVQLLLRGGRLRAGAFVAMLAAFLAVAILTGLGTIQVSTTYRMMLLWASYFFLFVVVTNGIETELGVGIVLGAVVVTFLAESLWSLLHLRYVLPFVRDMVQKDPRLLVQYFGTEELTPELAHRLNSNRAFGSLLFPNALGAFLVVGLPYVVAGLYSSLVALRDESRRGPRAEGSVGQAVLAGLATFVVAVATAFFLFTFLAFFAYEGDSWTEHPVAFGLYVIVLPLVLALIPLLVARFRGPRFCGLVVRAVVFCVSFVLAPLGLWFSYSRGAMMGLTLAGLFTGLLLLIAQGRHRAAHGAAKSAAVASALLVAGLLLSNPKGWAQAVEESAQPAPVEVGLPQVSTELPTEDAEVGEPVADNIPGGGTLVIEGRRLGVSDLTNLGSLRNRISYWRTGLNMAKAHFWTGVGLGNFRAAYPVYQPLGAMDVRMAHNDYLQTLCETGLFGLIALLAFWAYFAFWGAARIVAEADGQRRAILAGLYAGALAFLIHSGVDFNFYNPSLVFYLYLLAALFYVMVSPRPEPRPGRLSHQLLAVPFLVAAALAAGMALRVFLPDYILGGRQIVNVGDDKARMMKYRVGEFFLKDVRDSQTSGKPAAEAIDALANLIPLRSQLESFGQIWVPSSVPGGRNRRIASGEPVPPGAFLVVTQPTLARQVAVQAITRWLQAIKEADGIFPYDPETAAHLVAWYDLLLTTTDDPEEKREYTLAYLEWAAEGVKRSPMQAWHHQWYAKGLWLRANLEHGAAKDEFLRQGLDEFRRATELYPTSPSSMWEYGDALGKFGNYLIKTDREAEGREFIRQSEEALARSKELADYRPA